VPGRANAIKIVLHLMCLTTLDSICVTQSFQELGTHFYEHFKLVILYTPWLLLQTFYNVIFVFFFLSDLIIACPTGL
jgi:hypothetical protein